MSKLGKEENFLNMIMGTYKNLKANFMVRSGIKERLLAKIVLEVLTNATMLEKEIKDTRILKEEIKLFIHR